MLDNDSPGPLKVARDITEQDLAKYSNRGYKNNVENRPWYSFWLV